jgi:hypothetical protein
VVGVIPRGVTKRKPFRLTRTTLSVKTCSTQRSSAICLLSKPGLATLDGTADDTCPYVICEHIESGTATVIASRR